LFAPLDSTDIPWFGETRTSPKYTLIGQEDRDFCFGWASGKCDLDKEARSFSYSGWKYTSAIDIWGIPIPGLYKTYGGGGYITELDVNLDFSNRTLNELSDYFKFIYYLDNQSYQKQYKHNLAKQCIDACCPKMVVYPEGINRVECYNASSLWKRWHRNVCRTIHNGSANNG
jgi:hypothetical protein